MQDGWGEGRWKEKKISRGRGLFERQLTDPVDKPRKMAVTLVVAYSFLCFFAATKEHLNRSPSSLPISIYRAFPIRQFSSGPDLLDGAHSGQ